MRACEASARSIGASQFFAWRLNGSEAASLHPDRDRGLGRRFCNVRLHDNISRVGGLHLTGPVGYTAGMAYPRAGKDYPRSQGEFQAWFRTDADCLDYLSWLRWPAGFVCPTCGEEGGWRLAEADPGDRLVPDRVGDVASDEVGACAPGPRTAGRGR